MEYVPGVYDRLDSGEVEFPSIYLRHVRQALLQVRHIRPLGMLAHGWSKKAIPEEEGVEATRN